MFRNLAVLSFYSTFEACNRSYRIKQIQNSKPEPVSCLLLLVRGAGGQEVRWSGVFPPHCSSPSSLL